MAAIATSPGSSGVLMVFHSGGGLSYLQLPAFGYIAGFLPAAWLCGRWPNAMTWISWKA